MPSGAAMPPDVRGYAIGRGYAAGCEARLCRAGRPLYKLGATPLVDLRGSRWSLRRSVFLLAGILRSGR